jgi:hypothetical protein
MLHRKFGNPYQAGGTLQVPPRMFSKFDKICEGLMPRRPLEKGLSIGLVPRAAPLLGEQGTRLSRDRTLSQCIFKAVSYLSTPLLTKISMRPYVTQQNLILTMHNT